MAGLVNEALGDKDLLKKLLKNPIFGLDDISDKMVDFFKDKLSEVLGNSGRNLDIGDIGNLIKKGEFPNHKR